VTAAGGGVGLASLALIGCSDDGGGSGSGTSGGSGTNPAFALADQKDTTSKAVKGGTFGFFRTADPPNMDTTGNANSTTQGFCSYMYSRLLKWKAGIEKAPTGEIAGDLAQSWELSPDGMTVTLKMRPNAGTDPRPPLNGRMMTSADVMASFDRFVATSAYASNFFNDKSPSSPIISREAPDPSTVVLKLAFPYAPIWDVLADFGGFWVMPKEAGVSFDPRNQAFGSGPWMLTNFVPSSTAEFQRNPNWYEKDRPFLDGINAPLLPDFATQLAQFNAGRIWSGVFIDSPRDIPQTKLDHPELQLFQGEFPGSSQTIYFGYDGEFKDERVRQAASRFIDREAYAETFSGRDVLEDQGIPVALGYNTNIGVGWGEQWVDPFSKDIGDGGKNYVYDVSEGKKLLSAAGYPDGFSGEFHSITGTRYGVDWSDQMTVLLNMWAEGGIKYQHLQEDYATVYLTTYQYSKGHFKGASAMPGGVRADAGQMLQIFYHKDGSAARVAPGVYPQLDDLIERQLKELDENKRLNLTHDIQKELAKNMGALPVGFQVRPYDLAWPWLQNRAAYRQWFPGGGATSTEVFPYLWYDASKSK
jgi:ABC-type transport system substrate-binding protein